MLVPTTSLRNSWDKAVENVPPRPYQLTKPKAAPVFGPFQARADELLSQNDQLPRKQQYTAHKIFEVLQAEGYQESRVAGPFALHPMEQEPPSPRNLSASRI